MAALSEHESLVLSALTRGPLHGFDVGKSLTSVLGRSVGPGTYYRILHRLERQGYLSAYWEDETEAKTHQGPRRRYYKIEASGIEAYNASIAVLRRRLGSLRPAETEWAGG